MNTPSVNYTDNTEAYWNLIKDADSETKLNLISRLSVSLLPRPTRDTARRAALAAESSWTDRFAGRWQDDRTADELLADLRSARTPNREIEL